MSKRYQLLESWHNGCDNAVDEVFCESDCRENLEEILSSVCDELKAKGLGYDFPSGIPQQGVDGPGNPVLFLGRDISVSEHWRSFRIAENRPRWDFVYDEEYPDTAGRNLTGMLSDGKHYLFWHAYSDDEGQPERCHIYDSICMMPESEICSYLWTAENDSMVIDTLNSLSDESDYCGERCPLRTIHFNTETK